MPCKIFSLIRICLLWLLRGQKAGQFLIVSVRFHCVKFTGKPSEKSKFSSSKHSMFILLLFFVK